MEDPIKKLRNDGSPHCDGLTLDSYKSVSDLLGGDIVHIINNQLGRLVFIESHLEGARHLIAKVAGSPWSQRFIL